MRYTIAVAVLLGGFFGGDVLGQDGTSDVEKIANWIAENQSSLARYRWIERFAIEQDGRAEAVRIYRVQFDPDGRVQRRLEGTEVNSRTNGGAAASPLSRRLRHAGDRSKSKPGLPLELLRRVESYTHMQPGLARSVYLRAVLIDTSDPTPGAPGDVADDEARTSGNTDPFGDRRDRKWFRIEEALNPGDQLDLWVDRKTLHLRRLALLTVIDGVPVTASAEFTDLPDGLTYVSRSVIEATTEGVPTLLKTESFDFSGRR